LEPHQLQVALSVLPEVLLAPKPLTVLPFINTLLLVALMILFGALPGVLPVKKAVTGVVLLAG
jgi:hypothetical protein